MGETNAPPTFAPELDVHGYLANPVAESPDRDQKLDINDIPKAVLVLTKAYEFLVLNPDSTATGQGENGEAAG